MSVRVERCEGRGGAARFERVAGRLHGGAAGFFECEDDPSTARALVDGAVSVLRDEGPVSMRGPYNPTVSDECGLPVEGFVQLGWIEENNTEILENSSMVGGVRKRTWRIFKMPI